MYQCWLVFFLEGDGNTCRSLCFYFLQVNLFAPVSLSLVLVDFFFIILHRQPTHRSQGVVAVWYVCVAITVPVSFPVGKKCLRAFSHEAAAICKRRTGLRDTVGLWSALGSRAAGSRVLISPKPTTREVELIAGVLYLGQPDHTTGARSCQESQFPPLQPLPTSQGHSTEGGGGVRGAGKGCK